MSDKKMGYNPNSMNFGAKGWLFCLFSALVFFIPTALGSTWQMAVVYWEAAYGWNQVFILNMVTVGGLFTVIGAFLCGILVTKRSPRKLAIIWSAAYIIFLVIVGLSESLPLTCVCIVAVTMFGSNWCYNLNPVIVSNWFPRKKGLVMGIVTMGIPLAAGITTKILTWGFNNFGIRLMFIPYVVMAAIALVVLILFVTVQSG
ncbi:MAG: OFA family MFS transporter [Coprococcus sp.]|nr:OFA family MFS transporter [Coprococcus sp.]